MKIAVFCSANRNIDPDFFAMTEELGKWMGENGHDVVFGGCNMGLMDCIGNTKLVPSIKKGQSVTRPSFYVQTASFNAKFTTPGWFGRIYSIQTEITFGNLDVGIMSNNY